jgi:hypothetical protein
MKRKPLILFCLVLGAGLWALADGSPDAPAAAADKPPENFTLPVKLVPQETELWCWAATGQMTMDFFGKSVTQSQQANLQFNRRDCQAQPVPRFCVRGGDILIGKYGFTYDLLLKPVSPDEIVRQTYTLRKPLPFAWYFPGGGGHAGLVVGYNKANEGMFLVEILDPWPMPHLNPKEWSGGQRVFIPYSRWVGDYDHSFAQCMVNVTKKEE